MDDHTMGRRRLLTGAGAAAGGAMVGGLAIAAPAHADFDGHGRSRAEGSWLAKRFDPADGVERTFTFNIGRGGIASMVDISPVFITGQGPWTARGRRLSSTMVIGVPAEGEQPALVFRVYISGNVRGDEIEGTFTYDVFLDDGTAKIGKGEGSWSATRLTA